MVELLNTLAITYFATEVYFWYAHAHDSNGSDEFTGAAFSLLWRRRGIVAVLLLCNVVYLVNQGASAASDGGRSLEDVLGSVAYIVDEVLLTSLLFATIVFAVVYALWKHHIGCKDWLRSHIAAGYFGMFVGVYIVSWKVEFHVVLGISESYLVKLWGAIIGFFIVCYLDTRQTTQLSLAAFMEIVAESMLFVMPVLPLAAVVISTFMFITVSILENGLSVDPSFLNWPVYYSTLYGPFSLIYFRTKQTCRSLVQRQTTMV